MKRATVFRIANHSARDIVLWPKDEQLRKEWAILIKAGQWVMNDFMRTGLDYSIDLDECFFQFVGKKRKIKVDNVMKYSIYLDFI